MAHRCIVFVDNSKSSLHPFPMNDVCCSGWMHFVRKRRKLLKMTGFPTLKDSWPWPWIRSYCIPSCISHRPLPTCQISLKLRKVFVDGRMYARTYIRMYVHTDGHLTAALLGGLCRRVDLTKEWHKKHQEKQNISASASGPKYWSMIAPLIRLLLTIVSIYIYRIYSHINRQFLALFWSSSCGGQLIHGSCYTARVDSQHDGYLSATLTVCVWHTAWTTSRSLGLRGYVGESTSARLWMTMQTCAAAA